MKNSEIPSVYDFWYNNEDYYMEVEWQKELKEMMIAFAALHVTKALEMAAENAEYYDDLSIGFSNKESILNCYPKELIK